MALMDLLNSNSSKTLSSKWTISLFTSKKKNKYVPASEITGIPKEDAIELTMEIAQLQQALSKYIASNERKGSSVRTSLNELEMYIKELKDSNARPDFVTAAYQTKDSLLKTSDKFDENNWKATLDAVKTKKDIRKFYVDKNKEKFSSISPAEAVNTDVGGTVGTMLNVYTNGNSPTIQPVMRSFEPNVYRPVIEGQSVPSTPNIPSDGIKTPEVINAAEVVDTPQPIAPSNTGANTIYNSNTVVQEGITTSQNVTTSALNKTAMDLYKERMSEDLTDVNRTQLGHDYKTSINGLMSQNDDFEPVLYINQLDGTYYIKAYYTDENGNYDETRPYPYYNHPSLLHIERLEMAPSGDRVKCFAYKKGLKYKFVSDNTDMPDVYKTYWKLPEYQNYHIPEKQLDVMRKVGLMRNANS